LPVLAPEHPERPHGQGLVAGRTRSQYSVGQAEHLVPPARDARDARQVHQRGDVVRVEPEDPLERFPCLSGRPAPQRIGVKEQVAQVKPRLDVVGVGAGDAVVERLRVSQRAVEPCPLGAQDELVVGRQPLAVTVSRVREAPGDFGQRASGGGGREPVVRQREGRVRVHRPLKALHGVEVAPRAQLALAYQVCPERVE
jgi:hypothetical protein